MKDITYEISSRSKSFGEVARACAASVADHVSPQSVCGVRALQNSRELGVTDTCLFAGRADTTGTDTHLDNIGAGQNQLLHHLAGHHVASDQSDFRESCTGTSDVSNELKVINQQQDNELYYY